MSIANGKILNGYIADERDLQRNIASAVASLTNSTALLVMMAPWTFDHVASAGGVVTGDDLVASVAKFQEQLTLLRAQVTLLEAIEKLGDADPAIVAEGRAVLDDLNTGKPDFATRYTA